MSRLTGLLSKRPRILRIVAIMLLASALTFADSDDDEKFLLNLVTKAVSARSFFQCNVELDTHGNPACVKIKHLIAPKDDLWKTYSPIRAYVGSSVIIRLDNGSETTFLVKDEKICIGTAKNKKLIFCSVPRLITAISERNILRK